MIFQAQIYTVSRRSEVLSPAFEIDTSRQQEAIDEVERLEKKREILLRQGIERTKRMYSLLIILEI